MYDLFKIEAIEQNRRGGVATLGLVYQSVDFKVISDGAFGRHSADNAEGFHGLSFVKNRRKLTACNREVGWAEAHPTKRRD